MLKTRLAYNRNYNIVLYYTDKNTFAPYRLSWLATHIEKYPTLILAIIVTFGVYYVSKLHRQRDKTTRNVCKISGNSEILKSDH